MAQDGLERWGFPGRSVTHVNDASAYDPSMRAFVERELKLEPPDGFVLPPLDGEPLDSRVFTSTYHDTPTRSLARSGITLRRRVENGLSTWQLKLPREDGRAEIAAPGGPAAPPPELRALLLAHLRDGGLEQVATLRTRRSGVRVGGSARVADVTVDAVDILDGAKSMGTFVELEIELVDGEPADLERLGRILRKAGAKRTDGRAKVMRVLEVSDVPPLAAGAPALERLRYLLSAQLRELERHDPGVRLDDDPEDLHRFRVATRRARAMIRATRPLLGDTLSPLAAELKWLGGVLGPVRDLDVLLDRLRAEARTIGGDRAGAEAIIAALEDEREQVHDALLTALAEDRYLDLLGTFADAIASLPELAAPVLRPLAAAELRNLDKAARKLDAHSPDEDLHALRIHAKRARYAAELAAVGTRGNKLQRYVAALKTLQDVIGEHQDAVVAEVQIRRVSRAKSAVAAGRLIERECERRRERRRDYPDALTLALSRGRKALVC
jgi:CHAD domain-containing protein/adenylate cyclase class IV